MGSGSTPSVTERLLGTPSRGYPPFWGQIDKLEPEEKQKKLLLGKKVRSISGPANFWCFFFQGSVLVFVEFSSVVSGVFLFCSFFLGGYLSFFLVFFGGSCTPSGNVLNKFVWGLLQGYFLFVSRVLERLLLIRVM